jgi:hypothetical protein
MWVIADVCLLLLVCFFTRLGESLLDDDDKPVVCFFYTGLSSLPVCFEI